MGTPNEHYDPIIKRLLPREKAICKLIKRFGFWFYKNITDEEEFKGFCDQNVAIVDDIVGEQDAIDFAAKIMAVHKKSDGYMNLMLFFFPNYGKDELGYILMGHHTYMDAAGVLQFINLMSDNPDTHPFINAKGLNIF